MHKPTCTVEIDYSITFRWLTEVSTSCIYIYIFISLSKKVHINVYFKECVNGAIKKSDQFYPSLFVYHFECMRFIFLLEKKINSLKALKLVDFSNFTVN